MTETEANNFSQVWDSISARNKHQNADEVKSVFISTLKELFGEIRAKQIIEVVVRHAIS